MDIYFFLHTIVVPLGLGLLGFIEPCSLGTSLLFVKFLEGKPAAARIAQTLLFTVTRAVVIGALGIAAALLGSAFVAYQEYAWIALGIVYALLGTALLSDRVQWLARAIGPGGSALAATRGSIALGVVFGLNIPACAAPLLAALLGAAGVTGASGVPVAVGFVSLALFGLALSLPLLPLVFVARARMLVDKAVRHASRYPRWAGLALIIIGAWSIRAGLVGNATLK